MYVQVYGETAEYLVDHMSLQEVPDLVDWKTAAMKRIETIRKAKLCIRFVYALSTAPFVKYH